MFIAGQLGPSRGEILPYQNSQFIEPVIKTIRIRFARPPYSDGIHSGQPDLVNKVKGCLVMKHIRRTINRRNIPAKQADMFPIAGKCHISRPPDITDTKRPAYRFTDDTVHRKLRPKPVKRLISIISGPPQLGILHKDTAFYTELPRFYLFAGCPEQRVASIGFADHNVRPNHAAPVGSPPHRITYRSLIIYLERLALFHINSYLLKFQDRAPFHIYIIKNAYIPVSPAFTGIRTIILRF